MPFRKVIHIFIFLCVFECDVFGKKKTRRAKKHKTNDDGRRPRPLRRFPIENFGLVDDGDRVPPRLVQMEAKIGRKVEGEAETFGRPAQGGTKRRRSVATSVEE